MKKIILYSMLSVISLALVGCGSNSSSNAVKDLNSQLDRVQNSISTICAQDLSSFCQSDESLSYSATYQLQKPIYSNTLNLLNLKNKVSNDIALQNQMTSDLNSRIEDVKELLKSSKNEYSKNQIKALQNLTGQLNFYATKLKNSKDDVNEGVKLIEKYGNINRMNLEGVGSGYNSLSNALESRKAYCFNIANTLSQIESIVNNELLSLYDSEKDDNAEQNKNINIPEPVDDGTKQDDQQNVTQPRIIYNNNPTQNYGYNGNYGNYGYGYYNNGYGYNGYGYNFSRFNPGRNTDTYRPWRINIDTYRFTRRPLNNDYNNPQNNVENEIMPIDASATEKSDEKSPAQRLVEQNKEMLKNKRA